MNDKLEINCYLTGGYTSDEKDPLIQANVICLSVELPDGDPAKMKRQIIGREEKMLESVTDEEIKLAYLELITKILTK